MCICILSTSSPIKLGPVVASPPYTEGEFYSLEKRDVVVEVIMMTIVMMTTTTMMMMMVMCSAM